MQRSALSNLTLVVPLLASMALPATAGPSMVAGQFKAASMSAMTMKKATLAPMAYVVFCSRNPAECQANGDPGQAVALDEDLLTLLDRVNRQVNAAIRPKADRPKGPLRDVWSLAPGEGDCEDYAITKRHRLLAAGLPSSALLLAVGRIGGGEGHAVLVVRTREGDLVLDNRTNRIRPWREAGLSWLKMQSPVDPRRWMTL